MEHANQSTPDAGELTLRLGAQDAGKRLDQALAACLPQRSRSFLARLLKGGAILVNGRQAKPSYTVKGGEEIEIEWPEPEILEARPEPIPLAILYEDSDLIAVNKPAGMVAHPSAGHTSGTLVNALLAHCRDLSTINGVLRPGIVHRLDRDTSGVIVAAKNDSAHQGLQEQFATRRVLKQYLALCHGAPERERFKSEGRIGRHPVRRTEMTVLRRPGEGRPARTDFEVLQRLRGAMGHVFLVLARPHTGRTHQVRVHLAKSGFPVLADSLYGKEGRLPALGLGRQALHAWKLEFTHPRTRETVRLEAPLADDILGALRKLGGSWPAAGNTQGG
jgi:23S rRNA pseudouridine1911/1915/1917 synthase